MNQKNEVQYAIQLNNRGFLPGPNICACGNNTFTIQRDSNYKTSNAIFRCKNNKCKKRYQIRYNSFFEPFPKIKLKNISEIIKCFICREMSAPAIEAFLKNTYSIEINIITIRNILNEIRKIFYRYYIIEYQSNLLGERDANNNFSFDESLFTHNLKGEQIWVIGCLNN